MLEIDRLKNLLRLTSIYSVGKIGAAAIGFALYPIYTQFITVPLDILRSGSSPQILRNGLV